MKNNIMMNKWNHVDAELATNGISSQPWQGNNVVIDTRLLKQGDIFIALAGKVNDGHDFVKDAFKAGASVAVVSKNMPDEKILLVKDTREALNNLALYKRKQYKNKVIAVTGSSGKTSTKEKLFIAFRALGSTYANSGNFNNALGLPISIANFDHNSEYAIFEMGMNHKGEISFLTNIAKPDIAIITNVSAAHLAFFSSVEEIAKAKAEIFQHLSNDGYGIINMDCFYSQSLLAAAKDYGVKNILTFGQSDRADVRMFSSEYNGRYLNIDADVMGTKISYKLSNNGLHFAINSLACLAAVHALGGNIEKAANALINFSPLKGRGKQHQINYKKKHITIIDDSYNANPSSVKAGLQMLRSMNGKRNIAILADMLELGDEEISLHLSLKNPVECNNVFLIAYGTNMKHLYESINTNLQLAYFDDLTKLIENLYELLEDQDVILIKGSNGTGIHQVVSTLLNDVIGLN